MKSENEDIKWLDIDDNNSCNQDKNIIQLPPFRKANQIIT